MKALEKASKEYISDLRRRGYSEKTVSGYNYALEKFLAWLKESYQQIEHPSEITREVIAEYQMHLFGRPPEKKKKTKRISVYWQYNLLGALLWWMKWLAESERILGDPGATIRLIKKPNRIPRNYLSLREMQKMLKSPDTTTYLGLRDRAILELLYCCGIRNSEIRKIITDDCNLQDGWLTVRAGKGAKDRVVPLGRAAVHYLQMYLEKSRPALLHEKEHSFLFVNRYGGPLKEGGLLFVVATAAKAAGIKRRITPHCLRHTCATLMLRGKADIRHIQELLGHASLSSTQIYTRVEISDLKKVHERCHPREKEPIDAK